MDFDPVPYAAGLDRRRFVRRVALLAGTALLAGPRRAAAAACGAGGTRADEVLRVAFIGPEGAAGLAARRGAELGVEEAVQALGLLGQRFEAVFAGAANPDAAVAEAARLLDARRVFGLIGGFDLATARALGRFARERGVIFVNAGCPDDSLRGEHCDRTTFHVAASEAMLSDALALWRRDAPPSVADAPGSVSLWHPELERFGAGQLNDRFRSRFGEGMQPAGWASWMAVKVLWEAAARARTSEADVLARFLASGRARFDGHKGMPLSFRTWDHQLRQPLYVLGGPENEVGEVLGEVPRARRDEERGWVELLDQLGVREDHVSRCG
jgi:ABC-type branched-subunit amino acid transport system substrate-binding protein